MKIYLLSFALILLIKTSFAQTTDATGKVTDSQGKPVAFAFIADSQSQYATYSDSLGVFRLKIVPSSTLSITCSGYKDASVNVENKSDFNIVLSPGTGSSNTDAAAAPQRNNTTFESHAQVIDNIGQIMTKNTVEETHGSRYLFPDWVHGFAIDKNNALVQDLHSFYNYDKIDGKLLLTKDKRSAIAVDNDQLKSFTLFDHAAQPYVFEMVPDLNTKNYAIVLSSGKDCKIFKTVETSFEKANYKTDGVSSTGHNYDEYSDKTTYYLVKGSSVQKFELKKKSIKNAFASEGDKITKFMADQGDTDIDESYVRKLGDYLNK